MAADCAPNSCHVCFGRDDWGYPVARDGSREPDVPASDAAGGTQRRSALCPRLALSLRADPYEDPSHFEE